jgi:hypothetical protein
MNDNTPETDRQWANWLQELKNPIESFVNFARKLERERDEARKSEMAAIVERERWRMRAEEKWAMRRELEELLGVESSSPCDEQFFTGIEALRQLISERDEAREALAEWENAAEHVKADHPDEAHCGCVKVLRKLLTDALCERDEARTALREIEAANWCTLGELRCLARKAFEG